MVKNITRDDISDYLNQEFGLSKNDCSNIVKDIIDQIILGLHSNGKVKIHNFGTFKLRFKNERIGRNPKTKEDVMISARNVISFTPSKNFIDTINSSNGKSQKI